MKYITAIQNNMQSGQFIVKPAVGDISEMDPPLCDKSRQHRGAQTADKLNTFITHYICQYAYHYRSILQIHEKVRDTITFIQNSIHLRRRLSHLCSFGKCSSLRFSFLKLHCRADIVKEENHYMSALKVCFQHWKLGHRGELARH